MTGPYDESRATARWVEEPPKRAGRSSFERDRARVLHSAALRRLAAKTQVVEIGANDFPRTRLTHSLECAQIGRELGSVLGCDPDLVDAACLAHDLGHPPFGHNGESALTDLAASCGGFEGNAQSLRLLTRLETKVPRAGLNLTRATLDATLKYPWLAGGVGGREASSPQGSAAGGVGGREASSPQAGADGTTVKYGAYAEDAGVFRWIRDGAPDRRPCLEAQVMDWADDVAYSVHDLEDGLHAGLITFKSLQDHSEREVVARITAGTYCDPGSVTVADLCAVFDEFMALDWWPRSFDGGPGSLAALKNLTSELVGRFCRAAQDATGAANWGDATREDGVLVRAAALTRYSCDLVVPRRQLLECALLKGVTAHYVMRREGAAAVQAREREIIAELAAAIESGAPGALEPVFRPAWGAASSDAARRRVVVDQVASLTDTSAIAWHRRLRGPQRAMP